MWRKDPLQHSRIVDYLLLHSGALGPQSLVGTLVFFIPTCGQSQQW